MNFLRDGHLGWVAASDLHLLSGNGHTVSFEDNQLDKVGHVFMHVEGIECESSLGEVKYT